MRHIDYATLINQIKDIQTTFKSFDCNVTRDSLIADYLCKAANLLKCFSHRVHTTVNHEKSTDILFYNYKYCQRTKERNTFISLEKMLEQIMAKAGDHQTTIEGIVAGIEYNLTGKFSR